MSQKENLAPYSYYNYPFPSQSTTTGNNNLSPTILSENTCANTVYANDGLSLPTSHCIRMLKQKYQRKDKENQTKNKLFTNSRNNNQNWSAKNTGECLSLGGDDENCLGQLPETKNNDVPLQLPTRKNLTIRDEEFAAYREALLKQATLESQTLSSAQMEQLCQQQLLFQGELRKTQDDLKTLEEILKEAQYDRSQRDKDIQDSLQRSENELKATIEGMTNKISASVQETKELISFKLSDLQNTLVEIHSCLLGTTEMAPMEQQDMHFDEK